MKHHCIYWNKAGFTRNLRSGGDSASRSRDHSLILGLARTGTIRGFVTHLGLSEPRAKAMKGTPGRIANPNGTVGGCRQMTPPVPLTSHQQPVIDLRPVLSP